MDRAVRGEHHNKRKNKVVIAGSESDVAISYCEA